MSANKLKYFTVTTTSVVKANNQTDAIAAANRRSANGAKVLSRTSKIRRISAVEANELVVEATV